MGGDGDGEEVLRETMALCDRGQGGLGAAVREHENGALPFGPCPPIRIEAPQGRMPQVHKHPPKNSNIKRAPPRQRLSDVFVCVWVSNL